ncbi:MAG: hypothetical protein HOI21_14605 [Bacteroidetes Order II. Incertae sedis bacterium]|jgi:hypothetical protein|nr:hypothetical protein [Bacteroidetes Order II. bacterium]
MFILLGFTDHEGDTFLGAFSSHELATAARDESAATEHFAFDEYRIGEIGLDESLVTENSFVEF